MASMTADTTSPKRGSASASSMKSLLRRIEAAGFKRTFVQAALPTWWDDSLAESETGFSHVALLLARRLGIEVSSLLDPTESVALGEMSKVCFKTGQVAEALRASTSVALSMARLVAQAVIGPLPSDLPRSAAALRQQLQGYGSVVTLDAVLAWCWDKGIPVIHLRELPGRKPQALCLRHRERPYIFVCDGHDWSAWQAFLILHEIAHICLKHLSAENVLCVDETVARGDTQQEEAQANAFAVECLFGQSDIAFGADKWTTAERLAADARVYGEANRLDPGAIVLNVLHHGIGTPDPRVARDIKAATLLEGDPPALARIAAAASARLQWDSLRDDDAEFLARLTGCERREGETDAA